jgi:hypothetical protein
MRTNTRRAFGTRHAGAAPAAAAAPKRHLDALHVLAGRVGARWAVLQERSARSRQELPVPKFALSAACRAPMLPLRCIPALLLGGRPLCLTRRSTQQAEGKARQER